jgi:GT2 family glycosyltransferase
MLIATLNHNLPNWTDSLINQLKRDPLFKECELMVIDNGSTESLAKSTTHRLDENVFFGGGINVALEYFLSSKHEYMYFLNNDIVFHGPSFLTTSLKEANESNASIYSPSIINASMEQCHWKQMWNWGKGLRNVRWIDFQAPLIRRDIAEKIKQFPMELIYGWGTDFYAGCIADINNFKIVVSDTNTVTHMNSLTFKENKINIGVSEFCQEAERQMYDFFSNSEFNSLYFDLRTYGEQYDINSNTSA